MSIPDRAIEQQQQQQRRRRRSPRLAKKRLVNHVVETDEIDASGHRDVSDTTTPESLEQPSRREIRKQRTFTTFLLLVSVATVALYIKFARITELRNTLDEWWTKCIAEHVCPMPKQLEPILLQCAQHPQLVTATFFGITWVITATVLYVAIRSVDGNRGAAWRTLSIVVPLSFAMAVPVISTIDGFQPFSPLYIAYGLSYVIVGVTLYIWHND